MDLHVAGKLRRVALTAGWTIAILLQSAGKAQPAAAVVERPREYRGASDASGGVPCGSDFFMVCDDEDGRLRVYPRNGHGRSIAEIDLADFRALRIPGEKKELDLEAAATLGDLVYWIGSHGNNQEGKLAPARRQFFATRVTGSGDQVRVELVGQPYRRLVEDLAEAPTLREFRLAQAAAPGRAPKETGGFNIEGLAAAPDGTLWIGLRNPVPLGRALLVQLMNPAEMIEGKKARIGEPLLLDLRRRGVRDMVWTGRTYFVLAGEQGGDDGPKLVAQLYRWAGPGHLAELVADFPHLNPEAVLSYPDSGDREVQVLSDDGRKPALPSAKRTFRAVTVRW